MIKRIVLDPGNPASALASVQDFFKETQAVCLGMIDKVPEAMKDQVGKLKEKIDAALTQLASKPTEQVPAALDAASMLRSIEYTINYMQDALSSTMDALSKMSLEYGPKVTQLSALQGRLDKKELVESSEAEKATKDAVAAAVKAANDRSKLLSDRRQILAKADLPVPMDENAIDGEDKAFEATKTKTTDRIKQLKAIGKLSALNAEDLSKLVYGPDEAFNFVIKISGTNAGAGANADPLVGGGDNKATHKRYAIA